MSLLYARINRRDSSFAIKSRYVRISKRRARKSRLVKTLLYAFLLQSSSVSLSLSIYLILAHSLAILLSLLLSRMVDPFYRAPFQRENVVIFDRPRVSLRSPLRVARQRWMAIPAQWNYIVIIAAWRPAFVVSATDGFARRGGTLTLQRCCEMRRAPNSFFPQHTYKKVTRRLFASYSSLYQHWLPVAYFFTVALREGIIAARRQRRGTTPQTIIALDRLLESRLFGVSISWETVTNKNSLLVDVVIPMLVLQLRVVGRAPTTSLDFCESRSGETYPIHRVPKSSRSRTDTRRGTKRERTERRGRERRGMPSIRVGISRSSGFATACANKSKVFRKMAVTGLTRMSA